MLTRIKISVCGQSRIVAGVMRSGPHRERGAGRGDSMRFKPFGKGAAALSAPREVTRIRPGAISTVRLEGADVGFFFFFFLLIYASSLA